MEIRSCRTHFDDIYDRQQFKPVTDFYIVEKTELLRMKAFDKAVRKLRQSKVRISADKVKMQIQCGAITIHFVHERYLDDFLKGRRNAREIAIDSIIDKMK